ncbi:putative G2/M phase checkpoint control protein Sum2 [Plectosphaerella cucumerina]|uniref:G2/M phase checkpoint control protein Sum2 n=1 Tax=Plectosphaerella cucumerina TaxID=40658 RepID=A0A8K0X5D8_9PEZI|nr:putative G2/M phase checkpoint control protein Sum2 [Plectosphaerella cucumerina]
MSDFLGSRISLISKSDIRYVGVLHEINSDESTVSLENVKSFGTEGRKGRPEEEIGPSDQVYEYIIFRGSDVKDLRIEETPAIKENNPPPMPEDPAILGARPRPGADRHSQPQPGQPGQPGFGQPPFNQNNFYPPPGAWGPPGPGGRGGPGPGPGPPGNMPYPPPPGWFPPGPPGQGFPHAPNQWAGNNYQFPPGGPHMPPGPGQELPGPPQGPGGAGPGPQGAQNQKPAGPAEQRQPQQQQQGTPTPQGAPRPKSIPQPQNGKQPAAPTPPVESKPSAEEVKATAATLDKAGPPAFGSMPVPTGPKNNRVTPVVPLAAQKTTQSQTTETSAAQVSLKTTGASNNSLRDATQAAKAAVALAMANLNAGTSAVPPQPIAPGGNGAMDNLTRKVDEMRVNAARGGAAPAPGRGRGRGGRQPQAKVEVPDSDFDFDQANAKFNKTDLVKEAIAGPQTDIIADGPSPEIVEESPATAYNKKSSFFDNISSEAKDRADNQGQKPGGREWRGEEQRKNMETFGQGSVDGGHRNYRGRGRGRGRGFGRGRGGGNGGGYRGPRGQSAAPAGPN